MSQVIDTQNRPLIRPKGLTWFTTLWTIVILVSIGITLRTEGMSALKHIPIGDLLWLIVLYCLWRGVNWARQLFQILLVFVVLFPLFNWEGSPVSWFNLVTALIATFSLYWLNRRSALDYFLSVEPEKGIGDRILQVVLSIGVALYVARWCGKIFISLWMVHFGAGSWAHSKEELIKRGEKLTFSELIPQQAPPDAENFYADPIWMELLKTKPVLEDGTWVQKPEIEKKDQLIKKWKTPLSANEKDSIRNLRLSSPIASDRIDEAKSLRKEMEKLAPSAQVSVATTILEILGPAQPLTKHLSGLLQRPSAYYPIRYQDNFATPLPHISEMLSLAQMLRVRSEAALVLDRSTEAFEDTMMILGLQETMKDQPLLIALLVRESMILLALEPMNKGILRHQWRDSELAGIQNHLLMIDLQENLMTAYRGERAIFYVFLLQLTDTTASKLPPWRRPTDIMLPDQMDYYSKTMQATLDTMQQHQASGWNSSLPFGAGFDVKGWKRYLRWVVAFAMPAMEGAVEKTAECQTQVDQTLIACALERYRIAHGSYPASLDLLVPEYLAKLPNSPITGKPMNYSLKPDGTFLLWSTGWNLNSLGGKRGEYRGEGDIVWGQTVPLRQREKTQASQ